MAVLEKVLELERKLEDMDSRLAAVEAYLRKLENGTPQPWDEFQQDKPP